jgi:hypothetical protein
MIKDKFLFIGLISLVCTFLLPQMGQGQDERFFRQILSGDLGDGKAKDPVGASPKTYWYSVHTPYYDLDLNRDKVSERLVFSKKDNEDWLDIFDQNKKKIFSYRFENMGLNSGLYRVEQKKLSPTADILLLYYYVGYTKFVNTDASAQLYLLTIDNQNLKTMHILKGPSYFEEKKTFRQHYHLGRYSVELRDLNNGRAKAVIVKHRGMSDVLLYEGNGKWKTFLR